MHGESSIVSTRFHTIISATKTCKLFQLFMKGMLTDLLQVNVKQEIVIYRSNKRYNVSNKHKKQDTWQ